MCLLVCGCWSAKRGRWTDRQRPVQRSSTQTDALAVVPLQADGLIYLEEHEDFPAYDANADPALEAAAQARESQESQERAWLERAIERLQRDCPAIRFRPCAQSSQTNATGLLGQQLLRLIDSERDSEDGSGVLGGDPCPRPIKELWEEYESLRMAYEDRV